VLLEETEIDGRTLTEVRTVLMRLTSKRRIDEVPAALAAVIEETGNQLIEQASRAALWAEVATLPLPPDFQAAKALYEKILSLKNPIHRVREIHASRDVLESSAEIIRRAAAFSGKWGKTFTEMREFAALLNSLDYYLPAGGTSKAFLANWSAAYAGASITEEQVWTDLQNSKAAAEVEVESQKAKWRTAARTTLQNAIDQLPAELASAGIADDEFASSLSTRLKGHLDELLTECSAGRAPLLPDIARGQVQQISTAILDKRGELRRAAAATTASTIKQTTRVRLKDLGTHEVVSSLDDWGKLDIAVRRELTAGNEVEIG
jgi:hypothetical protein